MAYTVVWFKRDLRVHDHAPLIHAARQGPVLCLYVLEPSLWAQPDCALQHYGFLRESLRDLALQLRTCGATLQLAVGEVPEVLAHLHALQPFARLASHEETGNAHTYARDLAVARWCRQHCVGWQVKMLHPLEVLQRAEGAWRSGQAPLAAVEGFVRQILGWREYVRGIYWAHMPGY
ncbi:MAG: deoxyribodipyrimidine photo-lyase, partial [Brachymonas denitrificans]